ncbi:hypothetical protein DPMN_044685 [Dreissena polymorpha]|uniref:Uncharacterized protein n=1 Tax=Dreissena polymorpha TaxID=45954 RepID=A0A9D4D3N8_DREPO|nr:hypothetical protein DPMN_044685 [Dreissena polymorpha]
MMLKDHMAAYDFNQRLRRDWCLKAASKTRYRTLNVIRNADVDVLKVMVVYKRLCVFVYFEVDEVLPGLKLHYSRTRSLLHLSYLICLVEYPKDTLCAEC